MLDVHPQYAIQIFDHPRVPCVAKEEARDGDGRGVTIIRTVADRDAWKRATGWDDNKPDRSVSADRLGDRQRSNHCSTLGHPHATTQETDRPTRHAGKVT